MKYKFFRAAGVILLTLLTAVGCAGKPGTGEASVATETVAVTEEDDRPETEAVTEEDEKPETVAVTEEDERPETEAVTEEIVPEKLEDVSLIKDNQYSCSFDGISHDFFVELPAEPEGSPVIIMLHGYGNNAESFRLETGFHEVAVPEGYTVVYVTGAPDSAGSGTGWNSGLGDSGNRDVDFLRALSNYISTEYNTDRSRVYAVGFSNGAFMTHRLVLEAGDTFAGVVSVAGMMPESTWESRTSAAGVSVFQITGEKDNVVPKNSDGSAKYSKAPAIEDVIDYYVQENGLALAETIDVGKASELKKYKADESAGDKAEDEAEEGRAEDEAEEGRAEDEAEEGRAEDEAESKVEDEADDSGSGHKVQVWDLVIKDGRHSWPDEGITGIDINELILEFLNEIGK